MPTYAISSAGSSDRIKRLVLQMAQGAHQECARAAEGENTRRVAAAVEVITGPQVGAARALLDWRASDLTQAAGMGGSAIYDAERAPGVPDKKAPNVFKLQRTLRTAGVALSNIEGTVGARVRPRQS
jgi:hypothetical protein